MVTFLTVEQAANKLQVTGQAVTQVARRGEFAGAIQPWGPGGGWLIPASAVESRRKKKLAGKLNPGGRPRKSLSA